MTDLFLSSVLGKPVINQQGQEIGKLWDLVMIPGEGFPEVSHLLVKKGKLIFSFPWHEIILFNSFVISVRTRSTEMSSYLSREGEILVSRDILDKQIVDVEGAKVVRVNDLKLRSDKALLNIISVDIGFRGLLRRLGYERFWERISTRLHKELPHQEISWEYVQPLGANVSKLTLTMARDQMADMHPADIASIISHIPHKHIPTVLISLDSETAGEAIHELDPEMRRRVMTQLDSEQASDILEEMAPDEAADVLGDLPEEKAQELLGLMDEEEAEDIMELMVHEEDTAGGLMNSEYLAISDDLTISEALTQIRLIAPDVETAYYIYIIDKDEKPLGVITLKDLLMKSPDTRVADVMTTNLKTVKVEAEPEEILEIIAKYNLVAVPVLDEEEKMAGIVTVDDILELFLPEAVRRKRHHHH
ncbi:MAG TPA: CBS domain-containing protein [Geobacteraceae bacterium]|nr:CBS domain-containing protein [Geobacteraceae bacterium]